MISCHPIDPCTLLQSSLQVLVNFLTKYLEQSSRNTPVVMTSVKHLVLDPLTAEPPLRDESKPVGEGFPLSLPDAKETKFHPAGGDAGNASIFFVGTATTIL